MWTVTEMRSLCGTRIDGGIMKNKNAILSLLANAYKSLDLIEIQGLKNCAYLFDAAKNIVAARALIGEETASEEVKNEDNSDEVPAES